MTNEMPNEIYANSLGNWFYNDDGHRKKYIRADSQPADVAAALEDLAYLRYFIKTLGEQKQISLPEVEVMMPRIERVRVALKAQQPDVNNELLEALRSIKQISENAPELNLGNYTHDEVCELNEAMILVYQETHAEQKEGV